MTGTCDTNPAMILCSVDCLATTSILIMLCYARPAKRTMQIAGSDPAALIESQYRTNSLPMTATASKKTSDRSLYDSPNFRSSRRRKLRPHRRITKNIEIKPMTVFVGPSNQTGIKLSKRCCCTPSSKPPIRTTTQLATQGFPNSFVSQTHLGPVLYVVQTRHWAIGRSTEIPIISKSDHILSTYPIIRRNVARNARIHRKRGFICGYGRRKTAQITRLIDYFDLKRTMPIP